MMDTVLTLIHRSFANDEYGVQQATETEKEVFAQVHSVTRQEFFDGGRNGLNPQFMFTVFAGDYDEEAVCEYNGKRYAIYRAYHQEGSDYLELYVERKGGTNGAA